MTSFAAIPFAVFFVAPVDSINATNRPQLNNLGVDYIVHLAAAISVAESMKLPEKYTKINIDGSRKVQTCHPPPPPFAHLQRPPPSPTCHPYPLPCPQVLEWAKTHKVKNVVAASSAAVYGNPSKDRLPLKESEPYSGLSPYAK